MADMKEIGVTGLKKNFGLINDDFLTELNGLKGIKTYKEMLNNCAIVGAINYAMTSLIENVKFTTEPADNSSQAKADKEFVDSCFEDMEVSFDAFISQVVSMFTYGFAPFEKVFKMRKGKNTDPKLNSKYSDGLIGWRKFALRSQDTLYEWNIDNNGNIISMIQEDPNTFERKDIPFEKLLLFRTSTEKNNPQGVSPLRRAYRSWYFKKNIENIEAIGIERDLAGIPVAKLPAECMGPDASAEKKAVYDNMKKILKNLKNDEQASICIPSDADEQGNPFYSIELMTTGGTRTFDTDKVIRRYEQRIAMTVLADFILLGHEKVGSFALSSDKTDMFATALGSFLKKITGEINSNAIPEIFKINGMEREVYPKLIHGDIESVDLDILGRFVTSLANAGIIIAGDPESEQYLKDQAKIPSTKKNGN